MKAKPLDELEMFELVCAAYPERFPDDENETWNAAMRFADEISGFDAVADLLGRVVMLTAPHRSQLTGDLYHALGPVIVQGGVVHMEAVVKRRMENNDEHH